MRGLRWIIRSSGTRQKPKASVESAQQAIFCFDRDRPMLVMRWLWCTVQAVGDVSQAIKNTRLLGTFAKAVCK